MVVLQLGRHEGGGHNSGQWQSERANDQYGGFDDWKWQHDSGIGRLAQHEQGPIGTYAEDARCATMDSL